MAGKILFIEGAPLSESSGDLRKGFEKLLAQKLKGRMPSIKLGSGKTATIDKFRHNDFPQKPYLLIDLDAGEECRQTDLETHKLQSCVDQIFYMVQEMESWFLSQPKILDDYFPPARSGNKISGRLPKKVAQLIHDPKGELKELARGSVKKHYHETKHAVDLLSMLDAVQLEKDFPDFKRLIKTLKS